jgi:hypothetical protein
VLVEKQYHHFLGENIWEVAVVGLKGLGLKLLDNLIQLVHRKVEVLMVYIHLLANEGSLDYRQEYFLIEQFVQMNVKQLADVEIDDDNHLKNFHVSLMVVDHHVHIHAGDDAVEVLGVHDFDDDFHDVLLLLYVLDKNLIDKLRNKEQ